MRWRTQPQTFFGYAHGLDGIVIVAMVPHPDLLEQEAGEPPDLDLKKLVGDREYCDKSCASHPYRGTLDLSPLLGCNRTNNMGAFMPREHRLPAAFSTSSSSV
mmetsp:Transcript_100446/g.199419  ORF Transcript_100446/g.199419 Transcript_100446/m.199419 type:complete len:103 (+) Transcript_100446:623-931(+)